MREALIWIICRRLTGLGRTIKHPSSIALACLVMLTVSVRAVEPTAPAADAADLAQIEQITPAQVQAKIAAIQSDKNLDTRIADLALEYYQTALGRLELAQVSRESAERFRQSIETAPAATAEIQRQIGKLPTSTAAIEPDELPDDATLPELEQRLSTAQAQASVSRTAVDSLAQTLRTFESRPQIIAQEISVHRRKLEEIQTERAAPIAPGESAVLTEAHVTALTARHLARTAQIHMLEQELLSHPARLALTQAQYNLAKAQAQVDQARAKAIQQQVEQLRRRDAQQRQTQAEQTSRELSGRIPMWSQAAQRTAELSQQLSQVITQLERAGDEHTQLLNLAQTFDESKRTADQILDIGAVDRESALLLRQLRANLPSARQLRQNTDQRNAQLLSIRLERLRIQKERREWDEPGTARQLTEAYQTHLGKTTLDDPVDRTQLDHLIAARSEVLNRLGQVYQQLADQIVAINIASRDLALDVALLTTTLDERLLWLPDVGPMNMAFVSQVFDGLVWFAQAALWGDAVETLWARMLDRPLACLALVVLCLALWRTAGRSKRRLLEIQQTLGKVYLDSFSLTLEALAISFALALPWAALLGFIGWLLKSAGGASVQTAAVGEGLFAAGIVLLILRTVSMMCVKDGLFDAHFGWDPHARRRLGHDLRWLLAVEVPLTFVVVCCNAANLESLRSGLGRLAFVIGSIVLSVFLYRVLHPTRGVVAQFCHKGTLLWRLRGVWFLGLVGVSILFSLLAALGYYATATSVQSRLFTTAWITVGMLTLYGLAMRGLVVWQRKLALSRAREKLALHQSATRKDASSGDAQPRDLQLPQIDLSSISVQTKSLVRTMIFATFLVVLWMIWSRLVPALAILDQVRLWSYTTTGDEGAILEHVTLTALLLSLLVIALTLVATRNLPGFLEVTVLQRLSLDAGTRYAISTICRYVIIAVGVIIASNYVGMPWAQVSWLVAALGVGLGFGLQEIVANFVSGLIILFERPIRVGDTVTVGSLDGTVSRIQIRATTVVDWDNREILVPNKSFITDQVVNWTLSDGVTRVIIPVGIAYGSDPVKAHALMLETAKAHPDVLESPPPVVLFLAFGESSLDFEIRLFVREMSKRLPVKHDLHLAIFKALAEHGIEIPFPQRDLHLRSSNVPLGPGD